MNALASRTIKSFGVVSELAIVLPSGLLTNRVNNIGVKLEGRDSFAGNGIPKLGSLVAAASS